MSGLEKELNPNAQVDTKFQIKQCLLTKVATYITLFRNITKYSEEETTQNHIKKTRQTSAGQGKTLTLYTLGNEEQVDTIREWKTNQTVGVTHKGKSSDK